MKQQTIYLSQHARPEVRAYLESRGLPIQEVASAGIVGDAISCHPDIFYCRLGIGSEAPVIAAPELTEYGSDRWYHPNVLFDRNSHPDAGSCHHPGSYPRLGPAYPQDCLYNAACTGKYFLHKLSVTAPALRRAAEERGMALIDVPQGYTKCNVVIVDETALITSDEGIARACAAHPELFVLKIRPGYVELPGFPYGFLGGASGRIGDTVLFNGRLDAHPDHAAIRSFIAGRSLQIKDFPAFPLTDIGTIL